MRKLTPRETAQAERGCDEVPPTRPCMGGQYRPRKPNEPLRKEVERETDAPEGNLVIVERCARERQHLFSCREYGWDGTAHRFASTAYDTPRITALWSNNQKPETRNKKPETKQERNNI